jgi:ATP-dependent RNA helicase DDX54/DBP10
MGFAEQLKEILGRLAEGRQTLLFSATLPSSLVEFARAGLAQPALIRLDTDITVSEHLRNVFFTVRAEEKAATLLWMMKSIIPQDLVRLIHLATATLAQLVHCADVCVCACGQGAVVFVATRHHVEYLQELLRLGDISVTSVYGTMDQTARKLNLTRFRNGQARVLLVTDVAARGLDIPQLDFVINYDFPARPKLFVHRVGRVARAGRSGTAYSLVSPDEVRGHSLAHAIIHFGSMPPVQELIRMHTLAVGIHAGRASVHGMETQARGARG